MCIKRKGSSRGKRPLATVTGSRKKIIVFGIISNESKQLFRQYDRFDGHSFIRYVEEVKKRFKKFIVFVDRAAQHISKLVQGYLSCNMDNIKVEYFPVGSPAEFNAVEECWRHGEKYNILSNYYPSFSQLKQIISRYYRTTRFNIDIKKYLLRSTD